jgi:hypothetical protein
MDAKTKIALLVVLTFGVIGFAQQQARIEWNVPLPSQPPGNCNTNWSDPHNLTLWYWQRACDAVSLAYTANVEVVVAACEEQSSAAMTASNIYAATWYTHLADQARDADRNLGNFKRPITPCN